MRTLSFNKQKSVENPRLKLLRLEKINELDIWEMSCNVPEKSLLVATTRIKGSDPDNATWTVHLTFNVPIHVDNSCL